MHPLAINAILDHVANGATLAEAARLAGVPPSTVYKAKASDPDFKAALDEALDISVDVLEATARYRAIHGHDEPVIHQGQLTPVFEYDEHGEVVINPETGRPVQARNDDGSLKWLTVRKPSDTLLLALLKARRAEFRTERKEVTGPNGGPVGVTIVTGVPIAADDLDGIA